jgi:hypothetical protein
MPLTSRNFSEVQRSRLSKQQWLERKAWEKATCDISEDCSYNLRCEIDSANSLEFKDDSLVVKKKKTTSNVVNTAEKLSDIAEENARFSFPELNVSKNAYKQRLINHGLDPKWTIKVDEVDLSSISSSSSSSRENAVKNNFEAGEHFLSFNACTCIVQNGVVVGDFCDFCMKLPSQNRIYDEDSGMVKLTYNFPKESSDGCMCMPAYKMYSCGKPNCQRPVKYCKHEKMPGFLCCDATHCINILPDTDREEPISPLVFEI